MILTCVHSKTIASYFIGKIRAIVVEKLTKKDTHAQNLFYYDPKKKRDNDVFRIVLESENHCTVISHTNSRNKYSNKYYNCTGLVVIGRDRETGENISFLTHQDPLYFLVTEQKEKFIVAISDILLELKERSVP